MRALHFVQVMCHRFFVLVGFLWMLVSPGASGASSQSVELFVDVPPELAAYTGSQPVTLGIPFAPGRLYASYGMRVVDDLGHHQLAQFQVTSWWGPDAVRWLLVDLLVPIQKGKAPRFFFEFGPNVSSNNIGISLQVSQRNADIVISTGATDFLVSRTNNSLGQFVLNGVTPQGNPIAYVAQGSTLEVELRGPVRAVVKLTGQYVAADGSSVAQFVTRMRFYVGAPFVRLYHTLIWTADAATRIGSLRFTPAQGLPQAQVQTSVDDLKLLPAVPYQLQQIDWDQAHDASGQSLGQHWDGWVELKAANRSLFVALRWPWQQHPVGFEAGGGGLSLGLLAPVTPMSLAANDVVIPPLKNFKGSNYDLAANQGPYVPLSPRGVGKTYELLLWYAKQNTADYALDPAVKNTLLQRPVLAYAHPKFVAQAQLPSPLSAYNPEGFPELERAIENAFDWYTRERPEEWDYGVWNFGDLQYDWQPIVDNTPQPGEHQPEEHYRPDRYWLNNGKSWSLTPWLLWMRSGNRKYIEKGEAHARHVMDVDTCHVTHVPELKFLGGTIYYGPLHFGQQTYPVDFTNDSEYLPYYYFLTGYERARDVMQERVEGLLASYKDNLYLPDIEDMVSQLSQDYVFPSGEVASKELRFNREHYRVLGELALLYEATPDPRLKARAGQLLDFLLPAQASNGWLPGIKTNNWFSQSLNVAQRAFEEHRTAIRELLRRWQEHLGTFWEPGNTGQVDGPISLWDLLTLEEHTGDPQYLHAAAAIARTQALGFYEDENEWRGFGAPPAHELGPMIRDWVSVMGRLSQLPPHARPTGLAPATFFNASLTTQVSGGFVGRHVLFVLDEQDALIRVHLDVNARNAGVYRIKNLIRVIAPDGEQRTIDRFIEIEPTEHPTLVHYGLPSPFTTEEVAAYKKAITIEIPPDGETGAYAIEFYSANLETPVFARSSTGKLVHYFPLYAERTRHVDPSDLYSQDSQIPSVSSHSYGSQVWFKPQAELSPITLVHARYVVPRTGRVVNDPAWPYIRAFDPDGSEACRTKHSGTSMDGLTNPIGTPCQFVPASTELHAFMTQNQNWSFKIFMEGIEPFVSSTREEWFDPRQYPSPYLQQFLVPRD